MEAAMAAGVPDHRSPALRDSLRILTLAGVADAPFGTLTGGTFVTLLALALGATPVTIGLLAALPALGALVPLLVAPWLDRLPARTMAIRGLGLARLLWLAPLALLFAPPQWPRAGLFLAAATVSAFAGAVGGLAWLAWVGGLVPARLRGRYFGARNVASGAAGFLSALSAGPLIDGKLAGLVPLGARGGLFVVFALAVGLGVASVAALTRIDAAEAAESRPALSRVPLSEAFAAATQGPAGPLVLFSFAWNAALHVGGPFIPVYLVEELGLSATALALLAAATTAAGLATARAWGRVADAKGNLAVMTLSGVVCASLPAWWLVAPYLPRLPYAAANHVVAGVVWTGFNLAAANLGLAVAPRERRAVTLAVVQAATGLGTAVGPVAGGVLLHLLQAHPRWAPGVGAYGLVFAVCTACRFGALRLLRRVEEPGRRPGGAFALPWRAVLARSGRRAEARPAA
jgi:MFS family permease